MVKKRLRVAGINLVLLVWVVGCRSAGQTPAAIPEPAMPTAALATPAASSEQPSPSPEPSPLIATAEAEAPPRPTASTELPRQTRALWSWEGRTARKYADIDELVAQVDAARLNVILLGVYRDGVAYFEPSHHRFPEPAQRLTNQSPFAEPDHADALSYLLRVRDARRRDADPTNDFEVHAWFTVHRGGDADDAWPRTDLTQPYMLNALFPEFRLKFGTYYLRQDERYLHPAVSVVQQPRFQHYMADLMAGLVEDYGVDGIHLDYIRTGGLCFNDEALDYPGTAFDYPGCQADYEAWTLATYGRAYTLWDDTDGVRQPTEAGRERVAAWQVHGVGQLVRTINATVKAVNASAVLSVASVANVPWELPVQGQVAWAWLDAGWIDAVFPTLYLDSTGAIVERVGRLREAVQVEHRRSLIFPGLATYAFETREPWSDLLAERTCALVCREAAHDALEEPAGGVALFRSEYLSGEGVESLAAQPFLTPAQPYWGDDTTRASHQTTGEPTVGD